LLSMTKGVRVFALAALLVTAVAALAPAIAAQGTAQPPAAQDGFVPVKPGELEQEQLPAAPLVFVAYSVVWLAFVFYLLLLWRRMTHLERELRDVSAKLEARRP
jgi:CcmD family protein